MGFLRPVLWAVLFVLLNVATPNTGGPNASSRLAALSSMSDEGTFRIDTYVRTTIDWARTPDGHYYSNKAPGPMLLGFPIFFPLFHLEKWAQPRFHVTFDEVPGPIARYVTIWLTQLFPYAVLAVAVAVCAPVAGALSAPAEAFLFLSLFFGTTAAFFFNSFFGHGMAALFAVAAVFCLLRRRPFLFSLSVGLGVLCDYGVIFMIPGFFAGAWLAGFQRDRRSLTRTAAGLVVPAVLWIWYHTACFGAPWIMPSRFQNPQFVDLKDQGGALWGVIRFFPDLNTVRELLVGPSRGLLWTQPWVLLALILTAAGIVTGRDRRTDSLETRVVAWTGGLGMVGLLWMNGAFGGWHGGGTPGPRYLSAGLPLVGLWAALAYDRLGKVWKALLWIGMAHALVFYCAVYSTSLLATSEGSILKYYYTLVRFGHLYSGVHTHPQLRFFLALAGLGLVTAVSFLRPGFGVAESSELR